MTRKPISGQQAAARLVEAISAQDALSCEQAQEQLPAFVEDEHAGVDVDAMPAYAALLRHLDRCADCMVLYAELAADLETLLNATTALPEAQLTPPSFFTPARQSAGVVLRVLHGMARRFELTLATPRLVPAIATLGGGQRVTLFSDTLAEVGGAPFVSVSLSTHESSAEVLVAIGEAAAKTRWQVQLVAGDAVRTATTDERGIARFDGLPVADLQELRLTCSERSVGNREQ